MIGCQCYYLLQMITIINNKLMYLKRDYIQKTDELSKFVYRGGSLSITYQHIWSPLADKLVTLFPRWVAPNLITLISLLLLTFTHLLIVVLAAPPVAYPQPLPFLGEVSPTPAKLPTWQLLLIGCTILAYQTLDNIDGKQARRTKSSSPLGMLFDHGTDAVSAFLIGLAMLDVMRLSNSHIVILSVFFTIMVIQFAALYAQYCCGTFKLSFINPVDEGLPIYALLAFVTAFIDTDVLVRKGFYWALNVEIFIFLFFGSGLTVFTLIAPVFKQEQIKTEGFLLPVIYGVGLLLTSIEECWWPLIYVLMFSWGRNIIELQLRFITKEKFNVFNESTIVFIICCLLQFAIVRQNPANLKWVGKMWWVFVFIHAAVFFHFVVNVLRQGAQVLNIKVFSIQNREQEQKQRIINQ